jgi:hypothetical protein
VRVVGRGHHGAAVPRHHYYQYIRPRHDGADPGFYAMRPPIICEQIISPKRPLSLDTGLPARVQKIKGPSGQQYQTPDLRLCVGKSRSKLCNNRDVAARHTHLKSPGAKRDSGMEMIDEQLVRLRAHSNNIHRYRRLLKGNLTEHERQFVERRLTEEQSAMQGLTANRLPLGKIPVT